MTATSVEELAARILQGVPGAVARGITWCERGGDRAEQLLAALPATRAHVIGLTGAPGVGKSSLVSRLVEHYRDRERQVGVVAVDPSSPLTGGALLGDRVRFERSGDRGVFFRSLASRGQVGGLSAATRAVARVLSAAGFDPVLVETVGAGQAEVEIMRIAGTVVVVLSPGAGDEVQALKSGIMEIADIYALNKADRPGLGQLKSDVAALLHVGDGDGDGWRPPMVATVATRDRGVEELIDQIDRHAEHLRDGGTAVSSGRRGPRGRVLDDQVQRRFLASIYFALDGQWFLKVREAYGEDVARELNEQMCASLARVQLKVFLELAERGPIADARDLGHFIIALHDALYGDHRRAFRVERDDPEAFVLRYHSCKIYEMGTRAGFAPVPGELPGCEGLMSMASSWADAAGPYQLRRTPGLGEDGGVICQYRFERRADR